VVVVGRKVVVVVGREVVVVVCTVVDVVEGSVDVGLLTVDEVTGIDVVGAAEELAACSIACTVAAVGC
jgi:hypothetical protein